jgi:Chaperone of endosialidase
MRDYGLDGGDSGVLSADLQKNTSSATTAASITSKDSYSITIENLPVKLTGKYNFVFQYYYTNPDKSQTTPILGPTSATYSIPVAIEDLSTAPTNVVATGGFYSYQLKWDTPTFISYGDTIVYESNSNSFNSSSKVVYVGTANQCTILTSDIISKYVYVVHRDMFLDANKKGTVAGPITIQDPITVDTTGPSNVVSVTASGGLESGGTVGFNGYVDISWPSVTGNGIRGYRIRYKATGSSNYSYADSPGSGTSYRLTGLGVGITYEIAVATYDEYNNTSTSYVSATNVSISGTPFIANTVDVTGYFKAKASPTDADSTAFKFGYGVDTGKRGLVFNANNYWYIDSSQSASLKVGGSTSNYISWNGTTFTIDGDITARGGTFSGNIFMSTSNASIYNGSINSNGTLSGDGFALNSKGLKIASGTNSVTLDATSGQITANAGSIGGWTLGDSLLSKNDARLSSTGYIELGGETTDNIIRLDAGDTTYRMWIGRNSSATAPFKVTKEGKLYASGVEISGKITASEGAIGGWTINSTNLTSNTGGTIIKNDGKIYIGTDGDDALTLSEGSNIAMFASTSGTSAINFYTSGSTSQYDSTITQTQGGDLQIRGYYASALRTVLFARTYVIDGVLISAYNNASGTGPLYVRRDNGTSSGLTSEIGTTTSIIQFQKAYGDGSDYRNVGKINVGSTTTTPTFAAGSDERLKKNIEVFNDTDFLNDIKLINTYKFHSKDVLDSAEKNIGFLAKEFYPKYPDIVIGAPDAVDEDGDPVYMEIQRENLIPHLFNAIKQMSAKIEELESRI